MVAQGVATGGQPVDGVDRGRETVMCLGRGEFLGMGLEAVMSVSEINGSVLKRASLLLFPVLGVCARATNLARREKLQSRQEEKSTAAPARVYVCNDSVSVTAKETRSCIKPLSPPAQHLFERDGRACNLRQRETWVEHGSQRDPASTCTRQT
jgi:hypothetical protein